MKIKTDIHAGMTFEQCDNIRNYWKNQAYLMQKYAKTCSPQSGLYFPPAVYNNEPGAPVTPPPTPQPPVQSGSGCGWVNGVYYPDQSGVCG